MSRTWRAFTLAVVCGWLVGESAALAGWKQASPLLRRRVGHTSTLLPSGKVLVVGGFNHGPDPSREAEIFDPATGVWAAVRPLNHGRINHTATLLPSGKVLVVGGYLLDKEGSAEIFDPVTGNWEETESLNEPRGFHTATLLRSGKVLVVGGLGKPELFDPATGRWSELRWEPGQPAPAERRRRHTATLLPLSTGNEDDEVLFVDFDSVEIYRYHPATDRWTFRRAAPLQKGREGHTATLLPSGEVLIVGGNYDLNPTAEIYTPTGATSSRLLAQELTDYHRGHSATLLPSGKVLIAGGSRTVEIFDSHTEAWSLAGSLSNEAESQTATLLPSGEVLVVGGRQFKAPGSVLNTVEIYEEPAGWHQEISPSGFRRDPLMLLLPSGKVLVLDVEGNYLFDEAAGDSKWTRVEDFEPGFNCTATVLQSGKVLVAGGTGAGSFEGVSSIAEIFDPGDGRWTRTGSLRTARNGHTATLLPSGKVLVAGGNGGAGLLASAELFDPEAVDPVTGTKGRWEDIPSLTNARVHHTAILLASGKVLIAGGDVGTSPALASAEIYDPATGKWTSTGNLVEARSLPRTVLLASGKVLVVGGHSPEDRTAEIFDPETGIWTATDSPGVSRYRNSATLLPTGKVLVTGGEVTLDDGVVVATDSAEIYDPMIGTWEDASPLSEARMDHGAVVLASGKVLVLGGRTNNLNDDPRNWEIYDTYSLAPGRQRPEITSISPLRYGEPLLVEGTGFRGSSEASGGTTQSSAVDFPVIQLRSLDGRRLIWFTPQGFDFSDTSITVDVLPPGLDPGLYLLTVVVAGVPSKPGLVVAACSVLITRQPESRSATLGSVVTFEVASQGGESYEWRKDGQVIPGATGASYTTLPLTAADSGSIFSVVVRSRCTEEISESAVVTIADSAPPQVSVVSPRGGEYWLLSASDGGKTSEVVTWSMSDDIRICRVTVRLLFSRDGGVTYEPVPGEPLLDAGPGGACPFGQQPEDSSLIYEVPAQAPGAIGALYKIEVEATDHAGLVRRARSANPFFIVRSNPDAVRTLILTHSVRMERLYPGSRDALATGLQNLANHPRVHGIVVDLDSASGLEPLYRAWDLAPDDPGKANDVLFEESGLHDYLRDQIFQKFTGIRYLVLIGDDRIIPFARVPDGTSLSERTYVDALGGDLTSQSTVGKALAAGRYLSDELLAVRRAKPPFSERQIREGAFLPDLLVGRLVEEPEEIIATIARFISKDGLLDLPALGPKGHKVLVSGYDFLIDSGNRISQRWKFALGQVGEGIAPVNGVLLTPDWGENSIEDRRQVLRHHLAGSGGPPYGILSLNGHATHHQEGVPGTDPTEIEGLASQDLPNVDGALIYAVGCHGGLSVPAGEPRDNPLDLPQAFLSRGALAYIANTGYGWGLEEGVGYGERLVELFTEEMTTGGTVVVGEAVHRAKLRYFLQVPSTVNGYDEKTLLQWTFFGLPMYAVRTGIGSTAASVSTGLLDARVEPARIERLGPVIVKRRTIEQTFKLPRFLTQLNLHFDFSAEDVYTKFDALGQPVSGPGCPASATGCYYILNGVTGGGTGTTDLPIQPYFVYDSRLSGTSQHGALWMGGTYVEERGWKPVIAELASNGGDFSDPGATPRLIKPRPRPRGRPIGDDDSCLPNDLDLSSLSVVTGEVAREGGGWLQRLYQGMDLEVLYFNDQGQPDGGNCDREGPELGKPPFDGRYHWLTASTLEWAVPATDTAGVWRVIVVYDTGPDPQGHGSWLPLELEADSTGIWRGELQLSANPQLTYFIQTVDGRGNISWLDFLTEKLPASGVLQDLPLPVDVSSNPGLPLLPSCGAPVQQSSGPELQFREELAEDRPEAN